LKTGKYRHDILDPTLSSTGWSPVLNKILNYYLYIANATDCSIPLFL
jgi:hypothetical protein